MKRIRKTIIPFWRQSDDFPALLRSVRENPDDDTPKLVLADWYEEHHQDTRAHYIRSSIEKENFLASYPALPKLELGYVSQAGVPRFHGRLILGEVPIVSKGLASFRVRVARRVILTDKLIPQTVMDVRVCTAEKNFGEMIRASEIEYQACILQSIEYDPATQDDGDMVATCTFRKCFEDPDKHRVERDKILVKQAKWEAQWMRERPRFYDDKIFTGVWNRGFLQAFLLASRVGYYKIINTFYKAEPILFVNLNFIPHMTYQWRNGEIYARLQEDVLQKSNPSTWNNVSRFIFIAEEKKLADYVLEQKWKGVRFSVPAPGSDAPGSELSPEIARAVVIVDWQQTEDPERMFRGLERGAVNSHSFLSMDRMRCLLASATVQRLQGSKNLLHRYRITLRFVQVSPLMNTMETYQLNPYRREPYPTVDFRRRFPLVSLGMNNPDVVYSCSVERFRDNWTMIPMGLLDAWYRHEGAMIHIQDESYEEFPLLPFPTRRPPIDLPGYRRGD